MTALPMADPRKLLGASVALGLVLFAAAGIGVRADELIRFKNGHSLAVRSSSVEGEVVHVVLPNGSEASFPRSIVKLTETGVVAAPSSAPNVALGSAGRGPRGSELMGNRFSQAMAQAGSSSKKAVAEGLLNSNGGKNPQTVGFSRWGSDAIGVPAPGSETAPVVNMANRPRKAGNPAGEGAQQAERRPETAGPGLATPELMNPADRSHGHN